MNQNDLLMLYLDGELDEEIQEEIERALEEDQELQAEFNQLIHLRSHLSEWYQTQEESYPLDGFSDRVMESLGTPSWTPKQQTVQLDLSPSFQSENRVSWWLKNRVPFLVGALAAAAILLIANAFNSSPKATTPSTVLIQDKADKEASPVIWVLDEEESEDDLDNDDLDNDDEI